MSRLVDERVVEMSFDNSKFDKNVRQSMSTIEKLKSSLNFGGVSKSLNENLNGVNTSYVVKSVNKIGESFSALEVIAINVLSNITQKATDAGIALINSLSVDNIATGWDKYNKEIVAIRTLMAQGFETKEIDKMLNKLRFYTDETSYSYEDMVDNIGKFTAAGKGLEDSLQAMMGIANWAALSGQNASIASRVMYQLSQAVGSFVKFEDYRSIQTANMDTREFRQTALDTAVAMGTLQRSISGVYITSEGHTFDADTFKDYLTSDKWFTGDVLVATLQKYAGAVDSIYEAVEEEGSYDTASEAIKAMSDELDPFATKAFKSAQEARSLADAVNSVKEAVSSRWMSTFKIVFGSAEESVDLWTELANVLYDIFVPGGDIRNEILATWKELGGREDLFGLSEDDVGALWNIINAIKDLVNVIKEAWNLVFPISEEEEQEDRIQSTAQKLKDFTQKFQDWTKSLLMDESQRAKTLQFFKDLFSVLKVAKKIFEGLWIAIEPVISAVKDTINYLLDKLPETETTFSEWAESTTIFTDAGTAIASVLRKIFNIIAKLYDRVVNFIEYLSGKSITDILNSIWQGAQTAYNNIKKVFSGFKKEDVEPVEEFTEETIKAVTPLTELFDGLKSFFSGLVTVFTSFVNVMGDVFRFIGKILDKIGEKLKSAFGGEKADVSIFFNVAFWSAIILQLKWWIDELSPLGKKVKALMQGLADIADSKAMMQYAEASKNIAIAIAIIAVSIIALAMLDEGALYRAFGIIMVVAAVMFAIMTYIIHSSSTIVSGLKDIKNIKDSLLAGTRIKQLVSAIRSFALAVLIVAFAIELLGKMDEHSFWLGMVGAAMIISGMLMLAEYMQKRQLNAEPFARFASSAAIMAIGLVILSAALAIMAGVIKIFGKMDFNVLAQGFVTVVGFVSLMALLVKYIFNSISMKAVAAFALFSVSIAALAVSMLIMAGAIALLGSLDKDKFTQGILGVISIVGLLGILMLALSAFGAGGLMGGAAMLLFAASLIVLSIGMTALVGVFALIATMPMADIAKGLGVIVVALLALAALAILITPALPSMFLLLSFIAAFTVVALAASGVIAILALSLKLMVDSINSVVAALPSILDVIKQVLRAIIETIITTISDLSTLIAEILVNIIISFMDKFGQILDKFNEILPDILETVKNVFSGILKKAKEVLPDVFDLISEFIDDTIELLETYIPKFQKLISTLLDSTLTQLEEDIPNTIEHLINIIKNSIDSLSKKIPELRTSMTEFLKTFVNNLVTFLSDVIVIFVDGLFDFVCQTLDKLGESLVTNAGKLRKSIDKFFENLWKAFLAFWNIGSDGSSGKTNDLGYSIMDGLIGGLKWGWEKLKGGVEKVFDGLNWAFKKVFGIESPSKVFETYGEYIDAGLAIGIIAGGDEVMTSLTDLGDNMNTGFNKALAKISQTIDEGIGDSITITPVMDLSEIQNGTDELYSMMNNVDGYSISGSNTFAENASVSSKKAMSSGTSIDGSSSSSSKTVAAGSTITNNTFNITGDNPQEIADEVSKILQKQVDRRHAVWAN